MHLLLSQVYCVWQVVKTLTVIFNNPVHLSSYHGRIKCMYKIVMLAGQPLLDLIAAEYTCLC
jgi:hypothetical protein